MSSDQANILKRQEQISQWFNSDTDKASNKIKEAERIKFPKEVQFLCACNSNDWDEIDRLLNEGININCTQDDGLTALHQACIDEDLKLVKFLIDHGADIDVKDKEGWTPLFAAVSCNYSSIVKYLISCGARLDIVSFDGDLPIDQTTNEEMIAFLKSEMSSRSLDADKIRNHERVMMLRDVEQMRQNNNYDNYFLVDNGATMLHVAASKDYTDVLEQLLQFLPYEMLNKTDDDGWNALHVAAHWGHKRTCIILLEAEIDFDHCTNTDQTILEVADEDIKSYLREEIRKARFRRQEKSSVKRPAQQPAGEFQPSDNKIICPDKGIISNPVPQSPSNKDVKIPTVNGVNETPTQPAQSQSQPSQDTTTQVSPTTPSSQNNVKDNTSSNSSDSKSDVSISMDVANSDNSTKITDEKKSDSINSDDSHTQVSQKPSVNDSKKVDKPKQSAVMTPVKSHTTEIQRHHDAVGRRREKRVTQPVDGDQIRQILSSKESLDENKVTGDNFESNKTSTNHSSTDDDIKNNNESTDSTVRTSASSDVSTKNSDNSITSSVKVDSDKSSDSLSSVASNSVSSDSTSDGDKKKPTRAHLVNKLRVRDRPPTTTVDINDIRAAQREMNRRSGNIDSADNKNGNTELLDRGNINSINELAQPIDYKSLYESESREKDKLVRNLARIKKELQLAKEQLAAMQNNKTQLHSNNKINSTSESDNKELERLREENKKMKEANSALIRVISRLSHAQNKSATSASSTTGPSTVANSSSS